MLVDKARGLPWSAAPARCFLLQVGPGLAWKTRLERLAKYKHSSLLQKSVITAVIRFIVHEFTTEDISKLVREFTTDDISKLLEHYNYFELT
jgi:hypothetical protein